MIPPPDDVQRVKPKRSKIDLAELGVWGVFLASLVVIAVLTVIWAAFSFLGGFLGLL